MRTWHSNHDKKIGDIVQIARWEEHILEDAAAFFGFKPHLIDDVKFEIIGSDVRSGKIYLVISPVHRKHKNRGFLVDVNGASLIKVG